MKIILTGGAGFIGSHLAENFFKKKYKVVVIDNLSHPVKNYSKILKNIKFYKGDITNIVLLKKIFLEEKPQIVNHHAAISSISHKGADLFRTNIIGTLNLLQLSEKYKVKKFIFASSASVYGEAKKFPVNEKNEIKPICDYGISKAAAEWFALLYKNKFSVIIFRYSNVYGPRQDFSGEGGVISIFKHNINKNKKVYIYGDGKQTRDFINVKDVARANLKACSFKKTAIFNISSSKEIKIIDLFELMAKKQSKKIKPNFLPARLGDVKRSCLDNKLAEKWLKWKPLYSLQ